MPALVTEAIVLHAFDYLESSRILKLATRDGGVRSVLARGARRSSRRFGSALDLFAEGTAELHVKPGRDLDTLAGFDVVRSRPALATDLARFTGAAAISELALRFARDTADAEFFDALRDALDRIALAPPADARRATLAGAWRLVAALGFAPSLDQCSECHAPLDGEASAMFSHPAGGALCQRCGRLAAAGRVLPPSARAAVRAWSEGDEGPGVSETEGRAHQRLLREFLLEHLADDRPMRAYEVWEHEPWSAA